MLALIKEMRAESVAPVDIMGASCLTDPLASKNEQAF